MVSAFKASSHSCSPGRWVANGCLIAAGLALAYVVKWHYSRADAAALRWVLTPTAAIVELLSGLQFTFEPGAGYVNREALFTIAPSCAGVNFMIAAFLTLFLGLYRRTTTVAGGIGRWVCSAAVAYVAAVLTNALRIALALMIPSHEIASSWVTAAQAHRIEGIVVYVVCLYWLYVAGRAVAVRGGLRNA